MQGGGNADKTSVIDDIGTWWDQLNLEEWAKSVLDDIEEAVTGSKTLSKVHVVISKIQLLSLTVLRPSSSRSLVLGAY